MGKGVVAIILIILFIVFLLQVSDIKLSQEIAEYLVNKHISQVISDTGGICNKKIETNYDFSPLKSELENIKDDPYYDFRFIYAVDKYDVILKNCFNNRLKIKENVSSNCSLDLNSYLKNNSWESIKKKDDNWFIKLIYPSCSPITKTIKSIVYNNKDLNNFIKMCDVEKINKLKKYINCKNIKITPSNIFVLSNNKIAIKLKKLLYIINNINDMKEFIINKKYKNITSYSLYKYEYKYFYNTKSNKWLLIVANLVNWHINIFNWDKVFKSSIKWWIDTINYSYSTIHNNIYVLLKIKFKTNLQKYILFKKSDKWNNFKIIFNEVKDKNIKDVVLSGNKLIIKKKLFHLIKVFK